MGSSQRSTLSRWKRIYRRESCGSLWFLRNAEKTLFYLKEFLNVRDQTNADSLQKQLKMLDIEYDNRLLKLENAKREQQLFVRNLILGFLLLSVIVLGILFRIIYSARKRQEELLQKVRQQKQELNLLNKKKTTFSPSFLMICAAPWIILERPSNFLIKVP